MSERQDTVRRLMNGCVHGTTITIPCNGCVEAALNRVERDTRDNVRSELREDWKNMETRVAESQKVVEALNAKIAEYRHDIERLDADNRLTLEKMAAANKTIADLKLCRDIDQVDKAFNKPTLVTSRKNS